MADRMTDTSKGAALPADAEWKLVPAEPTQAMCEAARREARDWQNSGDPWSVMTWFRIYKRMLASAPVHPPAAPAGLQQQIMDLPCKVPAHDGVPYTFSTAYQEGHRDARHDAAELVGGAPIRMLTELRERIAEAHDASLDDDHRACRSILTECLRLMDATPVQEVVGGGAPAGAPAVTDATKGVS